MVTSFRLPPVWITIAVRTFSAFLSTFSEWPPHARAASAAQANNSGLTRSRTTANVVVGP
ncbi:MULTISPECIES: hypothetical protein [Frankia]|uniref:hypothetical protein n=1 Tax=Frankia TaxID=1854 RepID=UPI0004618BCB|nr:MULTISPECIES: hypothetical protein [Frankia]KDA43669.1 hypothetical protein BMG523Draft_01329 [Frankia sp. BMG5.23]KEZ35634.1 hypothetical protein CEDDRAFT_02944 [Frankia sp. CeD]KFB05261.1 hypothetical protein ALLO2DRAFT_02086 [Frankia sp. Allo2]OAA25991.1 hypothetical protein AAY23_103541 [Frankia casuarinae]